MSDLISKRAVLEFIQEENKQDTPDDFKIYTIQRFIQDMKPAYNMEAVVERLEEKARAAEETGDNEIAIDYREMDYCTAQAFREAIEIVKEASNG